MSTTNFQRIMGLLLLGAGIVLIALAANHVSAATLTVDDDGNAEYENIQGAVDNATDGDTIRVWEGTYQENVVVNKTIDLIGNGSEETTIDGGGSGDVVQITADWCTMSGFLVRGSKYWDSGIHVESDNNHIFENNCSNNDYGIYLYESSACTISNNTCSNNNGNGISGGSDSTFVNNICSNNNGSGISVGSSSTISNNTCENNRYGILLYESPDCTISNNTCSNNNVHGIVIASSDYCTITNNTCLSNNECGISLSGSRYCIITYNTISENRVGIIYLLTLYGSPSLDHTVLHNSIFGNTEYGINATENDGYIINAKYNWWGHDSGPYHPVNNTYGKGDNITDFMDFDPWIGKNSRPVATIQSISPNPALIGDIVTFSGSGVDDGTIERYVWAIDGIESYNGTQSEFTHSNLALGEHSITFWVQDNYGILSEPAFETIEIVQLGATVDGPGGQVNVSAGNTTSVSIMITNIGGLVDSYQLEVISIDDNFQRKREWISTLETVMVELDPGENVTVELQISINRSVSSDEYTISVRAVSKRDAGVENTTILTIFVDEQEDIDSGGGSGGFIPGFGAVVVIGAIVISIIMFRRKGNMDPYV